MAAPVLTRREAREQTRARLLDAAAVVFERRGFHLATLGEVAGEAGVTTGAVYSNFSGKQDMFLALADRQINERLEMIRQTVAAAPAGGIEEAVTAQFARFFDESAGFPLLFHEFWAYAARDPELRPQFASRRDAVVDALAEAVVAGAETRGVQLAIPAQSVAVALRAAMNGLAFDRAIDGDKVPLETIGWTLGTLVRAATQNPSTPRDPVEAKRPGQDSNLRPTP